MLLAAVAYVFSALNIAPLLFVIVGLSVDKDHSACVESVDGNIRVVIAHPSSHTGHLHQHEWLARMIVGNGDEGHADHVANFATAQTGLLSNSDGLDVKCPVSEMPAFEWFPFVAGIHDAVVVGEVSFESFAPPDIRPIRPVVWLI
jgi:hypothetical protein